MWPSVQGTVETQAPATALDQLVDAGVAGKTWRGAAIPGGFLTGGLRMGIMVMGFDAAAEIRSPWGGLRRR